MQAYRMMIAGALTGCGESPPPRAARSSFRVPPPPNRARAHADGSEYILAAANFRLPVITPARFSPVVIRAADFDWQGTLSAVTAVRAL